MQLDNFDGIIELSYEDSSRKPHRQYFKFNCEPDTFRNEKKKNRKQYSLTIEEVTDAKFNFYSGRLLGSILLGI
jgi:hypothetical protein